MSALVASSRYCTTTTDCFGERTVVDVLFEEDAPALRPVRKYFLELMSKCRALLGFLFLVEKLLFFFLIF